MASVEALIATNRVLRSLTLARPKHGHRQHSIAGVVAALRTASAGGLPAIPVAAAPDEVKAKKGEASASAVATASASPAVSSSAEAVGPLPALARSSLCRLAMGAMSLSADDSRVDVVNRSAIDAVCRVNAQRIESFERNWIRLAVCIAFYRANAGSRLCSSILSLHQPIIRMLVG
jgi:hypothetical protein